MTPEQTILVQNSYNRVYPVYNAVAESFYRRLFELDPSLRPLFPEDMHEQRLKLMTTFNIAVNGLRHPSSIVPILQKLGRLHADYGVQATHYVTMGDALLWTLQQCLGEQFTAEVESAWVAAYALIAEAMRADAELAQFS